MENQDSITVDNVTKTFFFDKAKGISEQSRLFSTIRSRKDKIAALYNISFKVSKGEVLGIIGLNGSGKTTLLRILAGIYKPDSGSVTVNGILAPLLQIGIGFHNDLNAKENIMMYGMFLGNSKSAMKEKMYKIIEFAELEKFSDMKLKHYSTGMRMRLAFATSLQIDPDILLVDEVLAVGDATFVKKSHDAFLSFKNKGKTIIFTSHNASTISQICNRVLLLHHGKLIMIGEPKETIQKYKEISEIE